MSLNPLKNPLPTKAEMLAASTQIISAVGIACPVRDQTGKVIPFYALGSYSSNIQIAFRTLGVTVQIITQYIVNFIKRQGSVMTPGGPSYMKGWQVLIDSHSFGDDLTSYFSNRNGNGFKPGTQPPVLVTNNGNVNPGPGPGIG